MTDTKRIAICCTLESQKESNSWVRFKTLKDGEQRRGKRARVARATVCYFRSKPSDKSPTCKKPSATKKRQALHKPTR